MTITQERFEQGMTYAQYVLQMEQNRDLLMESERNVRLQRADVDFFSGLPNLLYVLVLTEDWCRPACRSLPVLARLVAESGKLQLRIFLRDQNLNIMDQYLKDGVHRTIPTFVFFDHEFRELGRWHELPAKIEEMMDTMETELFTTDPAFAALSMELSFGELPEQAQERIREAYREFWINNQQRFNDEVALEIHEVVERGLASNA